MTVWDYLLSLDGPTSNELRAIRNESEQLDAIESEGMES